MNAFHFKGMPDDDVLRCLKGVQLPPVAGDMKTVSDSLELLKLLAFVESPAGQVAS